LFSRTWTVNFPTSSFQGTGITDMSPCAQPSLVFLSCITHPVLLDTQLCSQLLCWVLWRTHLAIAQCSEPSALKGGSRGCLEALERWAFTSVCVCVCVCVCVWFVISVNMRLGRQVLKELVHQAGSVVLVLRTKCFQSRVRPSSIWFGFELSLCSRMERKGAGEIG
jgi:hypothetical protein